MEATRTQETAGTWLQGHTTTTRDNLEAVFGLPTVYEEGDKVTIEWGLRFEDGTLATIYDWKRSPGWSVGGYSPKAVELVQQFIRGF